MCSSESTCAFFLYTLVPQRKLATTQSPGFSLFYIFPLSCDSPPSPPFHLSLLHVFLHLPEGLSETCACVSKRVGVHVWNQEGEVWREYEPLSRSQNEFLRYHVCHLLLTLVICLFFSLPFSFFLFWIGKSSARVDMTQLTLSDKTLIYSQSLKHKFSN